LLTEAARNGNDDTLACQLRVPGKHLSRTVRRKPKGGYTYVDVPYTASETLSEGEFNRFYVRALCRRAIAEGIPFLEVYRARK